MSWKCWISSFGLAVFAAMWAGCATPAAQAPYVCTADEIRTGDKLIISLLDIPEPLQDKEFVVREGGTINLPYLNNIAVVGKKVGDFEREVQKAYIDKQIYRQMTVVVKFGDRFYTVDGEVKAPARQVYIGEITVLRAIATCGGFNEYANRRKVEILRAGGEREIFNYNRARENPKKYDRPICPGDAIFVPRSL